MTALNYSAGTVSLTAGSAVVMGIDTAWVTALLKGGEIFVQAPGNPLPIATIDSDTQITAALKWTGDTGVYDYVLRIGTAYDQQIAKNAEILARLLAEIEAGTVWKYDSSGDSASRDFYDNRTKDFSYLDISGEQPILWVKASNDPGDWAGPFSYGVGPAGPAPSLTFSPVVTGEPGTPASLVVTGENPKNLAFTIPSGLMGIRWRGAYEAGVSYLERDGVRDRGSFWIALQDNIGSAPPLLPVTSNAFWELVASKGLDGSGIGDMIAEIYDPQNKHADAFDSANHDYDGSESGIAAITVQAAIDELAADTGGVDALYSQMISFYGTLALEQAERATDGPIVAGPDGNGIFDGFNTLAYVDVSGATGLDTSVPGVLKPSAGSQSTVGQTANPSVGATNFSGVTLVDRSYSLTNSRTVQSVSLYSSGAVATTLKIVRRNSAGNYDVVYSQSFSHPGGGWATMNLSTPYIVPASGTFHIANYYAASQTIETYTSSGVRSSFSGNASGSGLTFTESTGAVHASRAVLTTGAGALAVASIGFTLSESPAWATLLSIVSLNGAALNTDLMFDISTDGGSSWQTVNMNQRFARPDGSVVVGSGIIDLTNPTSTIGKWRIRTANGFAPLVRAMGVMMGVAVA